MVHCHSQRKQPTITGESATDEKQTQTETKKGKRKISENFQ